MTSSNLSYLDNFVWHQLANAEGDSEFFSSWLRLQVDMVGNVSHGVIVYSPSDEERFRPVAVWPQGQAIDARLMKMAEQALSRKQGLIQGLKQADQSGSTQHAIAFPIMSGQRVAGVVAISVQDMNDRQLQLSLRQLQWGSAWIESYLLKEESSSLQKLVETSTDVLELTAVAVDFTTFSAASSAALTELASRLKCDRVSLALINHHKLQVVGISHTVNFSRRMNLVRALEYAAEEAIDQEQVLIYPAPEDTPVVLREHISLCRLHGSGGTVLTVPLSMAGKIYGAIIFEFSPKVTVDEHLLDLCHATGGLLGPILREKWLNDRGLPAKVVTSAKTQMGRFWGEGYLGRKLLLVSLLLVCTFFYFATGTFRISSTAVLEGQVQRVAAAPFDGFIADAPVRAGDRVAEGDLLARLDDRDLQLEKHAWLSRVRQYERELQRAMAEGDRAQVAVIKAQTEEASAQLGLINQKLDRTAIRAPFDAVVISGDLSQSLGASVRIGDPLFQLTPLEGYRLNIKVDERDIAYVRDGESAQLVLTSLPNVKFPVTVQRITPVTMAEEGGNFFRVEASLDEANPLLRPGMEGLVKIQVEERRLIWIWTRNLLAWMRLQIWKWMP